MVLTSFNTSTLNVSNYIVNISSTEIYDHLYGNTFSYVIYCIVLGLILFVGPLLCLSIVLYERFGGDRQKRTIMNRLTSIIFTNIAFQSVIWSILRIVRDVFGLLPPHIFRIVTFVPQICVMSTLLFVTELTVFRFLYVVVWRRMKTIEDDFFEVVLTLSTLLIAAFFILSKYTFGDESYDIG